MTGSQTETPVIVGCKSPEVLVCWSNCLMVSPGRAEQQQNWNWNKTIFYTQTDILLTITHITLQPIQIQIQYAMQLQLSNVHTTTYTLLFSWKNIIDMSKILKALQFTKIESLFQCQHIFVRIHRMFWQMGGYCLSLMICVIRWALRILNAEIFFVNSSSVLTVGRVWLKQ